MDANSESETWYEIYPSDSEGTKLTEFISSHFNLLLTVWRLRTFSAHKSRSAIALATQTVNMRDCGPTFCGTQRGLVTLMLQWLELICWKMFPFDMP
ncbi:hypothetical protein AVEN_81575-1 [Araneus ventricosus]|uniref:Uncharacterized protein n=1 Tax=Araneus ventricosus TaxID=182803 RepID=A0A4Y2FQY7_ARAVE|nr:hypothetical protein AVEN_81575-1 [Araneus ventricosus]